MTERFNIGREVDLVLSNSPEQAMRILPALAGELMADGDAVALADLREALAQRVLHRGTNDDVASAVLSMLRTHGMQQAAQFNHSTR